MDYQRGAPPTRPVGSAWLRTAEPCYRSTTARSSAGSMSPLVYTRFGVAGSDAMPPNRFDRAAPPRPPKAPGKAFLARLDRLRRLASSCGAAVERSTRSVTSPTTVSGLAGELCPRGVRSHARKTLAEGIERRGHPASGAATRPPWKSTAGSTRSWIERDGGLSRPSGDPGRRDGLCPAASMTTAGPRGGSAGRDVGSGKSA